MERLRVWWIPQIPMDDPFKRPVKSIQEAKDMLVLLADYDRYQYEHKVKPDYSNVGGLEFFDGEEWSEFEDDEGYDIWEMMAEDEK